MNHVKTYPGEGGGARRVQNRPGCLILAGFNLIKTWKRVLRRCILRARILTQFCRFSSCFASSVEKKKTSSLRKVANLLFSTKTASRRNAPSGFPLHTCGRLKLLSQSSSNMSQAWIKLRDVSPVGAAQGGFSVVSQSQDTTGRFSAAPVDEKAIL